MTVLIAGSAGMVGSALVRKFKDSGFNVSSLSRREVDFRDEIATLNHMNRIKPESLIIAAAKVGGIGANNKYPVEFLEENLKIQQNLMSAAFKVGVSKLVFLGSSCIYPRNSNQPIREDYLMSGPLEPTNSAYAVAKIAGIELISSYRKEYGLSWISLMPTNLYGPGDNFNLQNSHVLPALIRRFIEARSAGADQVTLWGTGSPRREFLHIDDFSNAVVIALEKYNADLHLNIGSGEDFSIKELAVKVASFSGFKGAINWDQSKPDGTPRKVLDNSRIKNLGWEPTITLDDGIASTITWYNEADIRGEVRK